MSFFRFLSIAAFTLGLSAGAAADTFYFSQPDADEMRVRVLEGVLLEETDATYRIRIEGGEITIPKSLVTKVEKGGLTVSDIEQREKDAQEQLAAANQERRARQQAIAAAERDRRREAAAAEASARRSDANDVDVVASSVPVYAYDPVIGRAVVLDNLVEAEIRRGLGGVIRRVAQRELRDVRRELRRVLRRRIR